MVVLFPEQYKLQLCSDCLHSIWNTWEKGKRGCNHIEKQAGISSLFFPYIPTTCAPISVYSHSTFELKTQNQTLKCWQYEMHGKAGAGTHQEQAGLRVQSQQGSCSELIVWESHKQHG